MDQVLLTLRWQNILAVWIMVIMLAFAWIAAGQIARKLGGGDVAK